MRGSLSRLFILCPAALDDEYSVLNESSIPGYDPSNDEYSHLEDGML